MSNVNFMVLKRCSSERGEREKRFYGDGKDERRRTAVMVSKQPSNQAPARRGFGLFGLVVAVCVGVIIGASGTMLLTGGPEAPSPSRATMELDVALDTCHANMETCIAQLLSCLNKRERESLNNCCAGSC